MPLKAPAQTALFKNVFPYNLRFGDVDLAGNIDDAVISNNKDRDKVLATVASSVHDFCNKHGHHFIFAQGSSPARTRLYQMAITKNRHANHSRLFFDGAFKNRLGTFSHQCQL